MKNRVRYIEWELDHGYKITLGWQRVWRRRWREHHLLTRRRRLPRIQGS